MALFGSPAIESAATHAAAGLVLAGVIARPNPGDGFGILGQDSTHTALYRAGAALPGGAILREVYQDRVIVEQRGVLAELRLPRQWNGSDWLLQGQPQDRVAEANERAPPVPMPEGAERLAAEWLAGARPVAKWNDAGQFVGMRLTPNRRYRTSYGLRPNDILVSVDGEAVRDPDALQRLLAADIGKRSTLTVLREGSPMTIAVVASVGGSP